MKRRSTYRVTVRLDAEHDADLIAWLSEVTPGSRSALLRDTLRSGLRQPTRWEPVDIDEIRRVVAEELKRALTGKNVEATINEPVLHDDDLEARYGERLDNLLGGLSTSRLESDTS